MLIAIFPKILLTLILRQVVSSFAYAARNDLSSASGSLDKPKRPATALVNATRSMTIAGGNLPCRRLGSVTVVAASVNR